MRQRYFALITIIFSLAVLLPSHATQSGVTITLNPSTTYQIMRGLGAVINQSGQHLYTSGLPVRDNPDWPAFRDTLLDQTVNDLGLTQVRLEIRSSAENTRDFWSEYKTGQITKAVYNCHRYSVVNDNSNANSINSAGFHFTEMDETISEVIVPLRAVMAARGEVLHINVCYVSFTGDMSDAGCSGGLSNTHSSNPAEYAEFLLATYQHMQSTYGFVPDTWEIMLEPSHGNNWTIDQIGPAIVAAGDRLTEAGFTPHFVAPSNATRAAALQWFDQLIQTPGALAYMDTISFHTYNGWNDPTGLGQFASRANQYGLKTAMLEHIGATVDELHFELKHANISSFLQFVLASPSGTGNNRLFGISGTTVTVSDFAARYFRQYFRQLRPGAVRIGAQSSSGSFDPLAFRNSNGKYVVAVKTTAGGSFNVQGLPAGNYGIYYTTATQAGINLADQAVTAGQPLSASIASAGVITVYAKTAFDESLAKPAIASASVNGKKLFVFGLNFGEGAKIYLDGLKQKTASDKSSPANLLIAKKAGKKIERGQVVVLTVQNADGIVSDPFSFRRPN